MSAFTFATVGHGSTAVWYLTRSSGIVAFVLLTAATVLGVVASVGWTSERWPRFASQTLHRNLSLFCLVLVGLHVVTTVGDGYVPIRLVDAVVPFAQSYRPVWVGLGTLAFDLLVAVALTSALRRRIGYRSWRAVHWLAYLSWPIAAFHELGSGTDVHLAPIEALNVVCIAAVVGAGLWRLAGAPVPAPGWRLAGGGGALAVVVGLVAFALAGPLRPGWSHRAGTSPALLRQLGAAAGGTSGSASRSPAGSGAGAGSQAASGSQAGAGSPAGTEPAAAGASLPTAPFTSNLSGSYQTSAPNAEGSVQVVLSLHLDGSPATALTIRLVGYPEGGGVAMTSSSVTFGPDTGTITALDGTSLGARVRGPSGTLQLSMQLNLDRSSGAVTGVLSGSAGGGGGADEGNR
ncbi:MAG TPA: ferric reductase-like transmembrane domain-containing protein [Acidimicrobiales bacterium]|nr:ferric reductase-like transmembrane domain-containing protein [Acidimicrobiales bacterium]